MMSAQPALLPKLETGIPGFDVLAEGGLPASRSTLVAGTSGSGKTVFSAHFIAAGIEKFGQPGVFVTFEDSVADVRRNVRSFGWNLEQWEAEGTWTFVDAAPDPESPLTVVGEFDLSALLARIAHAVQRAGAKRVVLDSLNALFVQFHDHALLRAELFRITTSLKRLGVTLLYTGERIEEYGEVSRYGIEEFVADNVVILRNLLVDERRRRTLEVLKMRGARHQRGEFPFTVTTSGVVVLPLSGITLTQSSSTIRIGTGNAALDEMCGGGFFRDSIILLSGATGTGKTLTVTQFLAAGAAAGERCLLFAFEESRDQLFRNAAAWGYDFAELEQRGVLRVVNTYPHAMAMEDHLVEMRSAIEEFRPNRVAVDSLSALERVTTVRSFREFVISLTSYLKRAETAGLFTSTTPSLLGGTSVTEKHISTLTDTIVLLRYVESYGSMRRAITVLKMRGSAHDHDIREFSIDGEGMHVLEPFRDVSGVLSGNPVFGAAARDVGGGTEGEGDVEDSADSGDGDGRGEGDGDADGARAAGDANAEDGSAPRGGGHPA